MKNIKNIKMKIKQSDTSKIVMVIFLLISILANYNLPSFYYLFIHSISGKAIILLLLGFIFGYCKNIVLGCLVILFFCNHFNTSKYPLSPFGIKSEYQKNIAFNTYNTHLNNNAVTLEEEFVQKMTPLVHKSNPLPSAQFKATTDDSHNAVTFVN